MTTLYDDERIDDLQIRGYQIIQKKKGFCFGIDAVLLADYARPKKGSRVIDLCTGSGIVPILLEAKYQIGQARGLEIFPEYVEMAGRSIRMNGQEDRVSVVEGDVRRVKENLPEACADLVTCNPPYMIQDHGLVNPDYKKACARHEILCGLNDVTEAAAWLLGPGGHFVMVHRPFRLAEILCQCRARKLEPKRMRLVYPYVDKEPTMVLVDCMKGARQNMTVDPPLVVYEKDGSYSREIRRIYGI